MSTVLSFDTSADFCAAAVVRDGSVLAAKSVPMARGHAEALVPLIQELCAGASIGFPDIDLIGVTVGPGSFTGVRTGLSAAKGFALAAGCPAIGVSSLQAVAVGAANECATAILAVLDTRRNDYFAQLFDAEAQPVGEPAVLDAERICDLIRIHHPVVTGNALTRFQAELGSTLQDDFVFLPGPGVPAPADVACLAERILNIGGLASGTLSPLYLRAPEASIPPGGGRLKY
ncbi:MAG: tRNA (adenosine(37)-N6)-threonylcarbamoyltransferase complex dimerization subunit type 1 TsaB [Alphaproteobacteria bacterium]